MADVRQVVSWVWVNGKVEVGMERPYGALPVAVGDMDELKRLFDAALSKPAALDEDIIDYHVEQIASAPSPTYAYNEYGLLLATLRQQAATLKLKTVVVSGIDAANPDVRRKTRQYVQSKLN